MAGLSIPNVPLSVRIIAWAVVAAAIVWWPTRPTGFDARWVSMPAAMSWQSYQAARKAAPIYVPICKWPGCRLG